MPLNQERRSLAEFGRDIRWGATAVTPFVVVFGGMSLVGELLGVKFAGFNIERTIAFYVAFGLLAGVVVGALRPIAYTMLGAGVIGAIVGIPIGVAVVAMAQSWSNWGPVEVVALLFFDAISAACAVGFRRGYMRAEEKSRAEGKSPT